MLKKIILPLVLCLLFTACAAPGAASKPDWSQWSVFASDSGETLSVGMPLEDCEKVVGMGLEDGWPVVFPKGANSAASFNISVENGKIVGILIGDSSAWASASGVRIGDPMEKVKEALGEPESLIGPAGGDDGRMYYTAQFAIDEQKSADFIYCDEDGLITAIGASVKSGSPMSGLKTLIGRGSGDGHLDKITAVIPSSMLYATHDGAGTFRVSAYDDSGAEVVLFEREGMYSGSVEITSNLSGSDGLQVTADGNWALFCASAARN